MNREQKAWTAVGIPVGIGFLILAVIGVRMMGDPYPALVGMRVTDGEIFVKVPVCADDEVVSVRVHEHDHEATLWEARGPVTPEALRGEVTLWGGADFREAGAGDRPAVVPRWLEVVVSVSDGNRHGSDDVFDTRKAAEAQLPDGMYETRDGPKTAQQIDALLPCNGGPRSDATAGW